MKHILVLFTIILAIEPVVYAEDDKWIDGIRFRYGEMQHETSILLGDDPIIEVNNDFRHLENERISPVAIELPETLMSSWSYRGAVLEYQNTTELIDLAPVPTSKAIEPTTEQFRQNEGVRLYLYRKVFNVYNQIFVNANPNWALSADVTSSRIFLGYNWGVFFPAFENQRFAKFGLGYGLYSLDIELKLNLCSQYKVTPSGTDRGHGGECVGKKTIGHFEGNPRGSALVSTITLWEKITKDSIWRFVYASQAFPAMIRIEGNLLLSIASRSFEIISYTYRF